MNTGTVRVRSKKKLECSLVTFILKTRWYIGICGSGSVCSSQYGSGSSCFYNADPDPAEQVLTNYTMKSSLKLKKTKKDCSKVKKHWPDPDPNLPTITTNCLLFFCFSSNFSLLGICHSWAPLTENLAIANSNLAQLNGLALRSRSAKFHVR